MLGFWPLGQFALGQPGPLSEYVVTIELVGDSCLCADPTVYVGPPLTPGSNIVREGPGDAININRPGTGVTSNLSRFGPGRKDNIDI